MENLELKQKDEIKTNSEQSPDFTSNKKPKSSGNKNFRKHNKLGFYRFMRKKKKVKNLMAGEISQEATSA